MNDAGFDISAINSALDVAGNSIKTSSQAVELLGKIKGFFGKDAKISDADAAQLQALVVTLSNELVDQKLANVEIKEVLVELKEQLLSLRSKESMFEDYELITTSQGNMVYQLKSDNKLGEPKHYICPKCKEEGKRIILQGHEFYKSCGDCKNSYDFEKQVFNSDGGGGHFY